jgi:hypothetical protein
VAGEQRSVCDFSLRAVQGVDQAGRSVGSAARQVGTELHDRAIPLPSKNPKGLTKSGPRQGSSQLPEFGTHPAGVNRDASRMSAHGSPKRIVTAASYGSVYQPPGTQDRSAGLADERSPPHALGMFVVTEAEAAAIRAVFQQPGELSAAVELRRRFPGITDNVQARECTRTIASWKPRQPRPLKRMPKPPRDDRRRSEVVPAVGTLALHHAECRARLKICSRLKICLE